LVQGFNTNIIAELRLGELLEIIGRSLFYDEGIG
jgi:hypothetical protein